MRLAVAICGLMLLIGGAHVLGRGRTQLSLWVRLASHLALVRAVPTNHDVSSDQHVVRRMC